MAANRKNSKLNMGMTGVSIFIWILYVLAYIFLGKIYGFESCGFSGILAALVFFIVLILGYSGSKTTLQMIRSRFRKQQYREIPGIFRLAFVHVFFCSLVFCILCFIWGEWICSVLFHTTKLSLCLKVASCLVMLLNLNQIQYAYLFGINCGRTAKIGYFLERISMLVLSILVSGFFKGYGSKISAFMQNKEYVSLYVLFGAGIGLVAGSLLAFFYLTVMHFLFSKFSNEEPSLGKRRSGLGEITIAWESGNIKSVISGLARLGVWPLSLLLLAYFAKENHYDTLGAVLGSVVAPVILVVLLLLLVHCSYHKYVAVAFRNAEPGVGRGILSASLHSLLFLSLLCTVFGFAMAEQILSVINPHYTENLMECLRYFVFSIPFFALLLFVIPLLENKGQKGVVFLISIFGVVGLAAVLPLGANLFPGLWKGENYNGYLVAVSLDVGIQGILLFLLTIRKFRLRLSYFRILLLPIFTSAVCGLLGMGLCHLLEDALAPSILLGLGFGIIFVLYGLLSILLRSFSPDELEHLRGGFLIRQIGQLLRVYH